MITLELPQKLEHERPASADRKSLPLAEHVLRVLTAAQPEAQC
jgi:hypothetical protein